MVGDALSVLHSDFDISGQERYAKQPTAKQLLPCTNSG